MKKQAFFSLLATLMQRKKIPLVLQKALEIPSLLGGAGTRCPRPQSDTHVEFELCPSLERVIGQKVSKCQAVILSARSHRQDSPSYGPAANGASWSGRRMWLPHGAGMECWLEALAPHLAPSSMPSGCWSPTWTPTVPCQRLFILPLRASNPRPTDLSCHCGGRCFLQTQGLHCSLFDTVNRPQVWSPLVSVH